MILNVFDNEFHPHIQSEFQYNNTIFHLERYILHWIEYFGERGQKFSHIYEMSITTISNKRYNL